MRSYRRDGRPMRTGVDGEGPRGHTPTETERFSVRPTKRQPPSLQGKHQGPSSSRNGSRSRWRRCPERNVGLDQAPVRLAGAPLPLGMRGNTGMKRESQGLTRIGAQPGQPREGCQPQPQMPRRPSAQQESPVFGRCFDDVFEKQFDAGDEGCLHFIEAGSERRDVEVDANCLPCVTIPIGITLEGEIHLGVCKFGMADASLGRGQGPRASFHLSGTPIDARRSRPF